MKQSSEQFDPVRHFGSFAGVYDEVAFDSGAGLRAMNRRELTLVVARLGEVAGCRLLDAGAGTGRFSGLLHDRGAEVTAIDVVSEMLDQCGQNAPHAHRVRARLGATLPFVDHSFDAVVCVRVTKYVDDWPGMFKEFRRVLRPGGRLCLEIANRRSVARWGYRDMPIQLSTLDQAAALLRRAGLVLEAVDGAARLPFPLYRWAVTPLRAGLLDRLERAGDVAFGARIFSRSLILTCTVRV